jgi:hypothetical protein
MTNNNVLNYFEQTNTDDNPLVLKGTVKTGSDQNLKEYNVNTRIADISGTNNTKIVAPFAGTLKLVVSSVSGDPVGETKLSVVIDGGTSAGDITIADGSSADEIDTLVPTANNIVALNSVITITSDAGATSGVSAELVCVIEKS